MEKEFVPYELAVKLKEKGFDIDCIGFYGDDGKLYFDSPVSNFEDGINPLYCSAPLYQQVIEWFRKKHLLYILIEPTLLKEWQFSITKLNDGLMFGAKTLYLKKGLTYNDALKISIDEALKFI